MKPCNKKEIEEEFLEIGMIHNSHKIVLQRLLRPHYDFTIINSDEHENCRPNNNWRMCIYINQEEGGLSEIWVAWKEWEMYDIRQSLSPDSCMCTYVNYYLDGRLAESLKLVINYRITCSSVFSCSFEYQSCNFEMLNWFGRDF